MTVVESSWKTLDQMSFAHGKPLGSGVIRATPEDFRVDEILGFEPDGDGEHCMLHLRKRETNTIWLAKEIAKLADVRYRDVSYAGLKDRHAVTSQWFTVRLAGRAEPDWSRLESEQIEVLRVERHRRKLRTGALRGNRFCLQVRDLTAEQSQIEDRLEQLRSHGMPNYFGTQRFGHEQNNLHQAQALFEGALGRIDRKLRGLLISAARSQLFNEVLSERIHQQNWNLPIAGDYMNLAGSRSGFAVQSVDDEIRRRCQERDIHPSGPLWGRGSSLVSDLTLQLEERVLEPYTVWRNGLEHVGLKQERRPLRVDLSDLSWSFPQTGHLQLEFNLPAGSYATVLLRELISVSEPSQ